MPAESSSARDVLALLEKRRGFEETYHSGKGFGGIYHLDNDELTDLQGHAWRLFSCSNALYPGIFPSVRRMEAEIISMVVNLLNGGPQAGGSLTSGGTESILLAMLAHREQARELRGVFEPEIIAANTAHPALNKACHYFDIKIRRVGLDAKYRLDPKEVEAAINRNTILIYAGAPQFPHGIMDPIQELGQIALKHKIGLHVDNCLGGMLLTFMQKEGLLTVPFDLAVPGVTSMSVDLHKYGFASKGASVVAYADKRLRQYQYTTVTDFAGGLYCTATTQGSRSGATMAATWATLMCMGEEGYRKSARQIHATVLKLKKAIAEVPGLKLITEPDASVVAFTSDVYNIYTLADEMSNKGWTVATLQRPAGCHICVGEKTVQIADQWLADLTACATECMKTPGRVGDGMAGIYGMAGSVPEGEVADLLCGYIDTLYKVKRGD